LGRPFRPPAPAVSASLDSAVRRPAPAPPSRPSVRRAGPPTGRLRLLTTPPDAEIVIDGRRVGVGSVFDLEISPGARHLEVRARGYEPFDTTVVIGAGGTLSLGRGPARRSRGIRPLSPTGAGARRPSCRPLTKPDGARSPSRCARSSPRGWTRARPGSLSPSSPPTPRS